MVFRTALPVFAMLALAAGTAHAVATATPRERAEALYQARDWQAAAAAFAPLAKAEPTDTMLRVRYGASLIGAGQVEAGLTELTVAETQGAPPVQVAFHRARAYATDGRTDEAFKALDQAVAGGFQLQATLDAETAFANLRKDAKWQALTERIARNVHPCAYQPESRQFDFWIGEWDVQVPGMTVPATSRIELVEDRCIIAEYYENGPYAGRSLNVYDTATKKWRQFWVDNKGGVSHYEGEFKDGKMVYLNDNAGTPGGPPAIGRMTFWSEGPDEVRQYVEQSTDGGKTWTVAFNGTYKRRKKA